MPTTATSKYEDAFANKVGATRAFAFWKGRVALYAILKAMGIGENDEVVLPGYTCVMAVNPIVYLGAKPVFVDIEPVTYNMDPALIEPKITARTKAIIAQHTYGYPSEMDAIMSIASAAKIPLVEDCCPAFGSRYRGRPIGSFGIASYWSSQWNKPYSTGIGGMATTSDADLAAKIAAIQSESTIRPGRMEAFVLGCQLGVYRTLVYPKTTAIAQTIFRWMSKTGLALGSSAPEEFEPRMPEGFCKGMSGVQGRAGLRRLKKAERTIAHRREMARVYDRLLAALDWPMPAIPDDFDPVLVRYPVRVRDKVLALRTAAKNLVEIGSWFECPLHPIETPMDSYGYADGMCPVAERASTEVVNLPLHPRANESTAKRTVDFIAGIGPAENA